MDASYPPQQYLSQIPPHYHAPSFFSSTPANRPSIPQPLLPGFRPDGWAWPAPSPLLGMTVPGGVPPLTAAGSGHMQTPPGRRWTYSVPGVDEAVGTYVFLGRGQGWYNEVLAHHSIQRPTLESFNELFGALMVEGVESDDDTDTDDEENDVGAGLGFVNVMPSLDEILAPRAPPQGPAKCEICDDEAVLVDSREPRSNENFRERQCAQPHRFCRGCLAAWIHAEVSTGKSAVKCPAEGCALRLSAADIERLGDVVDVDRHRELLGADIGGKTKELLADPAYARWCKANTQQCPECSQLIEREAGCDDMMCLCGTKFCYKCVQRTDVDALISWPTLVERCAVCRRRADIVNRNATREQERAMRALGQHQSGVASSTASAFVHGNHDLHTHLQHLNELSFLLEAQLNMGEDSSSDDDDIPDLPDLSESDREADYAWWMRPPVLEPPAVPDSPVLPLDAHLGMMHLSMQPAVSAEAERVLIEAATDGGANTASIDFPEPPPDFEPEQVGEDEGEWQVVQSRSSKRREGRAGRQSANPHGAKRGANRQHHPRQGRRQAKT